MVRWRRLSLFGHVARMPDNVPAKVVLRVSCDVRDRVRPFPNWCRPWGRLPITWLHQICSDCGLSAGDALNCAQDRAVMWKTYATATWPCVDDDDAKFYLSLFFPYPSLHFLTFPYPSPALSYLLPSLPILPLRRRPLKSH